MDFQLDKCNFDKKKLNFKAGLDQIALPKLNFDTINPVSPSVLYSIFLIQSTSWKSLTYVSGNLQEKK